MQQVATICPFGYPSNTNLATEVTVVVVVSTEGSTLDDATVGTQTITELFVTGIPFILCLLPIPDTDS